MITFLAFLFFNNDIDTLYVFVLPKKIHEMTWLSLLPLWDKDDWEDFEDWGLTLIRQCQRTWKLFLWKTNAALRQKNIYKSPHWSFPVSSVCGSTWNIAARNETRPNSHAELCSDWWSAAGQSPLRSSSCQVGSYSLLLAGVWNVPNKTRAQW